MARLDTTIEESQETKLERLTCVAKEVANYFLFDTNYNAQDVRTAKNFPFYEKIESKAIEKGVTLDDLAAVKSIVIQILRDPNTPIHLPIVDRYTPHFFREF